MGYLMLSPVPRPRRRKRVGAGVAFGREDQSFKPIPWGLWGSPSPRCCWGEHKLFVPGFCSLLGFRGVFLGSPQAYYQYHSPDAERGMYISILEIVMAAFIGAGFCGCWGKLGVGADWVFIVISALTLLTTVWLFFGRNGARP